MFYVIQCIETKSEDSTATSWGVVRAYEKQEEAEAFALEAAHAMPGTFCVAQGVCRVARECRLEKMG